MKKAQLCIAILLFFILPGMGLAQEDTWTRKADMPTARLALSTSVVRGKICARIEVTPLSKVGRNDPCPLGGIDQRRARLRSRYIPSSAQSSRQG